MPDSILIPEPMKRRIFRMVARPVPGCWVYPLSLTVATALRPFRDKRVPREQLPLYWDKRARMLNFCLDEFSRMGKAFDIPFIFHGREQFVATYEQYQCLIVCSVHLPLNRCMHRALLPQRLPITLINGALGHNKPYVYGAPTAPGPQVVLPDQALLKVRRALKERRIVTTDIDVERPDQTIYLRTELLRLAHQTGTPVMFCATRLKGLKGIEVFFSEPHVGKSLADLPACMQLFECFMRPFVRPTDKFVWQQDG
ncbi:MAG: hypothetical protein M3347_02245 [Armatimonadota bacterium]|nr:hypothetical protein [Armatimonadota bacterium]